MSRPPAYAEAIGALQRALVVDSVRECDPADARGALREASEAVTALNEAVRAVLSWRKRIVADVRRVVPNDELPEEMRRRRRRRGPREEQEEHEEML